jgi:dolichyl-phosphate beta-glucosyltransferase
MNGNRLDISLDALHTEHSRTHPYLTVVLPAYNEEKRLPPTLQRVAEFLRAQPYTSEILVVENGSTDGTTASVERFIADEVQANEPFSIRLLHSEKGKGNAVRLGALSGRGQYLLFSDTDLAVPIDEVVRLLPPEREAAGYGIAIASREMPDSVRHDEPAYRHLMGRVFNLLVRWIAVAGIHDTQCGFKCFSREAAQAVFPLQRIDGWGFDAELLFIAQRHGIRIDEVAVDWYYGDDSRIRPGQDTVNMLIDLINIRRNGREGVYDRIPATTEEVSPV